MFKSAEWSNLIQQVPNCTPQLAKRIALRNPAITFLFLCNEPMYLEPTGANPARQFNPGDAVFFSGEPWFGSAPQCDSYQKNGGTTVYINPQSSSQVRGTACYVLADGSRPLTWSALLPPIIAPTSCLIFARTTMIRRRTNRLTRGFRRSLMMGRSNSSRTKALPCSCRGKRVGSGGLVATSRCVGYRNRFHSPPWALRPRPG